MASSASDDIRTNEEPPGEGVPGFGTALVAVLAIVLMTAILSALIYGLMVAIRPIEARKVSEGVGHPVGDVVRADHAIVPVTVL